LDVVVVPTLWYETASLIVQEAFAAGVPVVASHIGALQERVEDGVDGRFFPPGDSIKLHNILHQFLTARHALDRLQNGIKPVRTIEEHLSEIESIYTQIIP
jgi:glycosyltransferase involved in cell wall biosynthesis